MISGCSQRTQNDILRYLEKVKKAKMLEGGQEDTKEEKKVAPQDLDKVGSSREGQKEGEDLSPGDQNNTGGSSMDPL